MRSPVLERVAGVRGEADVWEVGFQMHGNMACGENGARPIVRPGRESCQGALDQPDTKPFDMTGRPTSGRVFVLHEGHVSDQRLTDWIERGVVFAHARRPVSLNRVRHTGKHETA